MTRSPFYQAIFQNKLTSIREGHRVALRRKRDTCLSEGKSRYPATARLLNREQDTGFLCLTLYDRFTYSRAFKVHLDVQRQRFVKNPFAKPDLVVGPGSRKRLGNGRIISRHLKKPGVG